MVEDAKVEVKEPEVKEEPELTLQEELTKAEKEVNEETVEDSSTQKETLQKETTEEVVEKTDEESALEKLDEDEDFKAELVELEKDKGGKISLGEVKRFKKIYWERGENDRKYQDTLTQLTELQNKKLSDNEVLGEGVKRGLFEQEPRPAKEEKPKIDVKELYAKATPEQKEWMDYIQETNKLANAPLQEKLEEYEKRFGNISDTQKLKDIVTEENGLRKDIKEKYGLDYDKDILPEMRNLIPELTKDLKKGLTLGDAGWTATKLANQVIVIKGFQLAKKTVVKEVKELNKTKKLANIETDTAGNVTPSKDEKKSLREIFNEETEKASLLKFE